jgi:hypothetical protein
MKDQRLVVSGLLSEDKKGVGKNTSISFISLISFVSSEKQVCPVQLLRSSDQKTVKLF